MPGSTDHQPTAALETRNDVVGGAPQPMQIAGNFGLIDFGIRTSYSGVTRRDYYDPVAVAITS